MVYGIVNIANFSILLDIISNYLDKMIFLAVQIDCFKGGFHLKNGSLKTVFWE